MIEIVDNADTTSNIQVVSTHAHPLLFVPLLQTNPLSLLPFLCTPAVASVRAASTLVPSRSPPSWTLFEPTTVSPVWGERRGLLPRTLQGRFN